MDPLSAQKKKKINIVVLTIGALALVLGFFPPLYPVWVGVTIFVFSLVVAGIVKIVLPDPDPDEALEDRKDSNPPQIPGTSA